MDVHALSFSELSDYVKLMSECMTVAGKAVRGKHVVFCSEMPESQNSLKKKKDLKFHAIQSNHTSFHANGRKLLEEMTGMITKLKMPDIVVVISYQVSLLRYADNSLKLKSNGRRSS